MKNNKLRFILVVLMLCVMILLTAFFLTLFKVIDLKLINEIIFPKWLDMIGSALLFTIQTFFMIANTTKLSYKKIAIYSIIYIPINAITYLYIPNIIGSGVIPIIYSFIIFICHKINRTKKEWLYGTIWFILFNVIVMAVSYFLGFIKINNFGLKYNELNLISGIIVNIDLYLFLNILFLTIKGVKRYVQKLVVFSESESVQKDDKHSKESLDLSGLNKRQKLIFWCMAMGYQVLQLGAVVAVGFINNTIIELIAMLLTFWIGRRILGKCWHSEKLSICTFFTIASFYVLTKITLPFSISLFTCIILSASFTYGLYILGLKQEHTECLINELNELKKPKPFCLDNCTESELLERCRQKKLSKLQTERAIKLFINKQSIEDVAFSESVEIDSIYKAKQRIKNKLS